MPANPIERERQARLILGDSERHVAEKFVKAARSYAKTRPPSACARRTCSTRVSSAATRTIVIVPSTAVESMQLGGAPKMATVASAIVQSRAAGSAPPAG
jgi:hypothetical protein